ncbi:MAG: gliding motility-associated ABC transporter ATP-binding subunit GldA [Bacteroidota bacterium]
MSILVSNISKSFGTQKALDAVSFQIKKGEIVGFLGPNGAGKSTMMRILTTYHTADEGEAEVNGFDIHTQKQKVKQSIGFLPEHNPLYLDMYVREYLNFSAEMYGAPKSNVSEAIEKTGLTPEAHKKIGQLSKGYRQRVGLAAALLHDPEVLILDEPTTGLDPNQLVDIRKLIQTLGKEKTILFSTHILKEVEAVCDRVIIINKGKLVADQNIGDLKNAQEQVIEVEFDEKVDQKVLAKIPEIKSVSSGGKNAFVLTFSGDKDHRPVIFDFAQNNGLKILQLNRKNQNLESVFAELTGQSEHTQA